MVKFISIRRVRSSLRFKGTKFIGWFARMKKRLLWVTMALLGVTWFIGRYLNNPLPPDMQESWFYNLFTGGVALIVDLVSKSSLQKYLKYKSRALADELCKSLDKLCSRP